MRLVLIEAARGPTRQLKALRAVDETAFEHESLARVDDAGGLFVTEHQQTSIHGLYPARDLVRGLNQISVANGLATISATAINNDLPNVFAAGPPLVNRSRVMDAANV